MTAVRPRFRSAGRGSAGKAREVLELAERVGLELAPWQASFVRDALAVDRAGRWVRREAGLVCPRQNGKGRVLEAIELGALFVLEEELTLHSAHEFKTATEAFRRVWS